MYLMTCMSNEDTSASVSAQSDQSLRSPNEESLHPWLSKKRTWKILNLRWAHRCEGTFSDVTAQIRINKLFNA